MPGVSAGELGQQSTCCCDRQGQEQRQGGTQRITCGGTSWIPQYVRRSWAIGAPAFISMALSSENELLSSLQTLGAGVPAMGVPSHHRLLGNRGYPSVGGRRRLNLALPSSSSVHPQPLTSMCTAPGLLGAGQASGPVAGEEGSKETAWAWAPALGMPHPSRVLTVVTRLLSVTRTLPSSRTGIVLK